MKVQGFLLYRVFYGEHIVYIGRTKQPLQNRIRGHLFSKPMHRTIDINQVTKIEYAALQTEADMNLYEIYYILTEHPPLNVDDKTRDFPTVSLPSLTWSEFRTPLWEKWREAIRKQGLEFDGLIHRHRILFEELRVIRSALNTGQIGEDEYWERRDQINNELAVIRKKLKY